MCLASQPYNNRAAKCKLHRIVFGGGGAGVQTQRLESAALNRVHKNCKFMHIIIMVFFNCTTGYRCAVDWNITILVMVRPCIIDIYYMTRSGGLLVTLGKFSILYGFMQYMFIVAMLNFGWRRN